MSEIELSPSEYEAGVRKAAELWGRQMVPLDYRVPHAHDCQAVYMSGQPSLSACPDPLGFWKFCTCGVADRLAQYGFLTLRMETLLSRTLDAYEERARNQ